VVHGRDGLDEITITDATKVAEQREGRLRIYEIHPEEFNLRRAPMSEITGGDVQQNAGIIRAILAGERSPRRDIVLLNAAAALVAAGRADSIAEAMPIAGESLDSGAAQKKLQALVEFTNAHP
jgi:anthranilate phosphoribosyltransferase